MVVYVALLHVFLIIYLFLFLYLFRKESKLANVLSIFSFACFIFILGSIGVLHSKSLGTALIFEKIKFFGSFLIMPTFFLLLYSLVYGKPKTGFQFIFFTIPLLTLVFVASSDSHELYYVNATISKLGGFTLFAFNYGIVYYIYSVYHILLIMVCMFLLFKLYNSKYKPYKTFSILLFASIFISLILDILLFVGAFQKGLDLRPLSSIMQLVILYMAIFHSKIFTPYEFNDSIISVLADGVIILDSKNRFVYSNQSARDFLRWLEDIESGSDFTDTPIRDNIVNGDLIFTHQVKNNDQVIHYEFKKTLSGIKPFLGERHTVYILYDISDRVELEHQLERRIKLDGLTNIYNQSAILSKIDEKYRLAKKNNTSFSIIILDIDNFKAINDQYGHMIGNKILVRLANEINRFFEAKNCVRGRFGGDEFIMSTYNFTKEEFLTILKQFSNLTTSFDCQFINGLTITTSIGGAFYDFKSATKEYTCEEIINIADKAMYEAKEQEIKLPIIKYL